MAKVGDPMAEEGNPVQMVVITGLVEIWGQELIIGQVEI